MMAKINLFGKVCPTDNVWLKAGSCPVIQEKDSRIPTLSSMKALDIKISFEFFLSSQSLKTVNLDEITSSKKGYFLIQILEYIFILFFYYCADENVQKLQNRQIFLKKNIQSVEDMLTIINLQAICQQAMVGIPNKAGYYCK